jgi:hypothetical protein
MFSFSFHISSPPRSGQRENLLRLYEWGKIGYDTSDE